MLILRIGNIYVDMIGGDLTPQQWKGLEKKLSFRPQGYLFSPAYNKFIYSNGKVVRRIWDGWKRQFWKGKKRIYFPTGLYSLAQEYFQEQGIEYQIEDIRIKPEQNIDISDSGVFSHRDYQAKVINDACSVTRGIIHAATGSGKTIIASGIINELKVVPFIFFVTSIDLLTQAKESLEQALLVDGKHPMIGQVGGGIIDIQDITVMTVQTAVRALGGKWNKYKFDADDSDDKTPIEERKEDIQELIRTAKGSICDEVQHWRADTCQLVARGLESGYYTYGMSATPYRDAGDDMMIQACFGRKIAEITASQLIKQGWLMKPDIKMIHIRTPKTIYKQWQAIYKDQVVENDHYNGIIANIANAYIENGRLVLILVQQINHGKRLEELIPDSQFLSGQSPKKKREAGIKNLRNKYISCIISTTIFDEGIDIKPLDTVILAGGGKSRTRAMQRIGRIIRPFEGKEKATAIDFCIHQKYLKAHSVEREKMYRTEPEYMIEDIDPQRDS